MMLLNFFTIKFIVIFFKFFTKLHNEQNTNDIFFLPQLITSSIKIKTQKAFSLPPLLTKLHKKLNTKNVFFFYCNSSTSSTKTKTQRRFAFYCSSSPSFTKNIKDVFSLPQLFTKLYKKFVILLQASQNQNTNSDFFLSQLLTTLQKTKTRFCIINIIHHQDSKKYMLICHSSPRLKKTYIVKHCFTSKPCKRRNRLFITSFPKLQPCCVHKQTMTTSR